MAMKTNATGETGLSSSLNSDPLITRVTNLPTTCPPPPPPPIPPPPPPPPTPALKKVRKVKTLHWKPTSTTEGSFWGESTDVTVDIEPSVIENLFRLRSGAKVTQVTPAKRTSPVDSSLMQNFLIIFRSFGLASFHIRNSIIAMDSRIGLKEINALLGVLFSKTKEFELEKVDPVLLKEDCDKFTSILQLDWKTVDITPAESVVCGIVMIPHLRERLMCWRLCFELQDDCERLDSKLRIITTVAKYFVGSQPFKDILRIVLQIGNVMNEGTSKGGYTGFELDILRSLRSSKTTCSGTGEPDNLMELVITILSDSYPQSLEFDEECVDLPLITSKRIIPSLSSANRLIVFFEDLEKQYRMILNKTLDIEKYTDAYVPFQSRDRFKQHMDQFFLESGCPLKDEICATWDSTIEAVNALTMYYNPSDTATGTSKWTWDPLFNTLDELRNDFIISKRSVLGKPNKCS